MRPMIRFLDNSLIERIISEARDILLTIGIEINNESAISLLTDSGAKYDKSKNRVMFGSDIIDSSLETCPDGFKLYDTNGVLAVDLAGYNVNFTPGSTAINILDPDSNKVRRPNTADYIRYTKIMSGLEYIASQSTAMIASDVPESISDSYRLFLSLLYCDKPVVTGCFKAETFEIMKEMHLIVRGSESAISEKPLTLFSCCPTAPLKWSGTTSQNVIDCAKYSIPIEFISMPLSGFVAPVTMVGSLVQHTAETLSGIVISQLVNQGTPILYGGSPAVFDIRYETTPMGDIGTMMIDCAYNEIGKYLNLPTQAYIALSDAKLLDAQAGMETAMGATLAALSGINNISGPGMIDFESCFSLEKLILDNDMCGTLQKMLKGINPKEDFPSAPHFQELLNEGHLLISDHTRKYLKDEIYFPGNIIDRANRSRWIEEGSRTLMDRAKDEIDKIVGQYKGSGLDKHKRNELINLMTAEAKRHGFEKLPEIE